MWRIDYLYYEAGTEAGVTKSLSFSHFTFVSSIISEISLEEHKILGLSVTGTTWLPLS